MGFPRYVYKRGTGKKVGDNGFCVAESTLVKSEAELAELGPGWCESPVEALPHESHPKKVK
jgi:hypothetical protein